ncbi:hypothetical protein [Proteus cibi]|uniref:hypothetical protein n=1 Tax=Proteus cibi TaxID=2050966 RepID=UPI0035A66F7C
MTVSTELSHEEYVGNGVTTDFDFRFRIFEGKHLIVVVADSDGNETTLKNGTDYTIVGAGSFHGGKVVLNKPLAQGWKILLERDLPVVQETDLRNQGKFFAEVHEDAFDYLTMLIQKALGTFSLSLRKPTYLSNYYDAKGNRIANLAPPKLGTDSANKDYVDNSIKDIDSKTLRVKDKPINALPNTEQRANKILAFDDKGQPITVLPESGSASDVLMELKKNTGASLINSSKGISIQEELNFLKKSYVSNYNGDINKALKNSKIVIIDEDVELNEDIIINSGDEIYCNDNKKIITNGYCIRTSSVSNHIYYFSDTDTNKMVYINNDIYKNEGIVEVSNIDKFNVGDKIIIRNGYCDMWRVLEKSTVLNGIQNAVREGTFIAQPCVISSINGNKLKVSGLSRDIKLIPKIYGYLDNENNIPLYYGYNKPNILKVLYKDIKLDLNILPSFDNEVFIKISFTDNLNINLNVIAGNKNVDRSVVISYCDNVTSSLKSRGGYGAIFKFGECCYGNINNISISEWKGGADSPLLIMTQSIININNAYVEYSGDKINDKSGIYFNTVDSGNCSNIICKNFSQPINASFSSNVIINNIIAVNCDIIASVYKSYNISISNGRLKGYWLLDGNSTIYTTANVGARDCEQVIFNNIYRDGDEGYGSVYVERTRNSKFLNLKFPKTNIMVVTSNKDSNFAIYPNNLQCFISNSIFNNYKNIYNYAENEDPFSYKYPFMTIANTTFLGDIYTGDGVGSNEELINIKCNKLILSKQIFGIHISGICNDIEYTNIYNIFPNLENLTIINLPDFSKVTDVKKYIDSGNWNFNYFYYGFKITDLKTGKTYKYTGNRKKIGNWI